MCSVYITPASCRAVTTPQLSITTIIIKMAKRSNPYIEDFLPQSKVHVGLKQFNNNEDRLKKVYEKTLDLLFKGAKKSTHSNSEDLLIPTYKDKMKQLFLGKDGTLLHSGTIIQSTISNTRQCHSGGSSGLHCAYCERRVCSECEHHCTVCDQSYCSHCSLIGSEGAEVCVSCYV